MRLALLARYGGEADMRLALLASHLFVSLFASQINPFLAAYMMSQ